MFRYPADYLVWIVLLPLLGAAFNGLLGRRIARRWLYLVACGTVLGSFALSVYAFTDLQLLIPAKRRLFQDLLAWIPLPGLYLDLELVVDPLSVLLMLVITGVGFLIHLYSTEYMEHDRGVHRYFAYLNLFVAAMLILVMGGSLPVMFIGWEGVGLCSYLLIGFWFSEEANARAGRKAFVVNRIGDFGFLLGMFVLYSELHTLDFGKIEFMLGVQNVYLAPEVATAAALLLFLGATGKSAQIPLYIWLPDAMAGPTPVSALIHAATMVTAGVYMIARLATLYVLAPSALAVVAGVGAATALLAAAIAVTQTDIKKVLAYSTVSQLGYMFVGVGVGAFGAGIFHLFTHAFFKALLFLGSGAVIHAMEHAHAADDPQDVRTMGGLLSRMPLTAITFIVATLAIAGVPGLSGFFSKDEILWRALTSEFGATWIWAVGLLAALLTAFYMTRLVALTFLGRFRGRAGSETLIHDPSWRMGLPLAVLAVLSVVAGYVGLPHIFHLWPNYFEHWLAPVFRYAEVHNLQAATVAGVHLGEGSAMLASILVAFAGIGLAWYLYVVRPDLPGVLARRLRWLWRLSYHKFYVDELYALLVVRPLWALSRWVLFALVDRRLIDFAVEGVGRLARGAGALLRLTQTGDVATYLAYMTAGAIALVVALSQL